MTITNNGATAVTLVGASTPRAQSVSIHESRTHMEMIRMQPMPQGLVIEAGKTVELQPRGYHLMLEMISKPLEEGERVPLTLQFDGAPAMEVELAVQPLAGEVIGHEHGDGKGSEGHGEGSESGGSHQH